MPCALTTLQKQTGHLLKLLAKTHTSPQNIHDTHLVFKTHETGHPVLLPPVLSREVVRGENMQLSSFFWLPLWPPPPPRVMCLILKEARHQTVDHSYPRIRCQHLYLVLKNRGSQNYGQFGEKKKKDP